MLKEAHSFHFGRNEIYLGNGEHDYEQNLEPKMRSTSDNVPDEFPFVIIKIVNFLSKNNGFS